MIDTGQDPRGGGGGGGGGGAALSHIFICPSCLYLEIIIVGKTCI